jgi:hypothetical protein
MCCSQKINKVNGTQIAPSYGALIKPRGIVVANLPQRNYLFHDTVKLKNLFVKSSLRTPARGSLGQPVVVAINSNPS